MLKARHPFKGKMTVTPGHPYSSRTSICMFCLSPLLKIVKLIAGMDSPSKQEICLQNAHWKLKPSSFLWKGALWYSLYNITAASKSCLSCHLLIQPNCCAARQPLALQVRRSLLARAWNDDLRFCSSSDRLRPVRSHPAPKNSRIREPCTCPHYQDSRLSLKAARCQLEFLQTPVRNDALEMANLGYGLEIQSKFQAIQR